jgi:hypothetical protein
MSPEATAATCQTDGDTPSHWHRIRQAAPRGGYAHPDSYRRTADRVPPLRPSDAELCPARNHEEELMVAWLDGEGCEAIELPVTATAAAERPKHDGNLDLWAGFDPDTMVVTSYINGEPRFGPRRSVRTRGSQTAVAAAEKKAVEAVAPLPPAPAPPVPPPGFGWGAVQLD